MSILSDFRKEIIKTVFDINSEINELEANIAFGVFLPGSYGRAFADIRIAFLELKIAFLSSLV